jgi:hypothetical protein
MRNEVTIIVSPHYNSMEDEASKMDKVTLLRRPRCNGCCWQRRRQNNGPWHSMDGAAGEEGGGCGWEKEKEKEKEKGRGWEERRQQATKSLRRSAAEVANRADMAASRRFTTASRLFIGAPSLVGYYSSRERFLFTLCTVHKRNYTPCHIDACN